MPRPVTSNNPGDSFYVSPSDFDTENKNIAPFVDAGYYWSGQEDQHQAINFFRKICRNLVEKIDQLLTLKRDENHNLPLACTPLSSNGALAPS